ncbi:MAG: DUF87 domain-containing protein [Alteromonadaceae bacterium]|nr:DUF87 domain-containing protein [Alteromonadaceae bacterium]
MPRLSGVQRLLEVGLIASTCFALFLYISIATFNAADPGWSQTGFSSSTSNAAGPIGAMVADFLYWTFGFTAWIVPFAIAFAGWLAFHNIRSFLEWDFLTIGLRIIGGVLILIGLAGIFSLNMDDAIYITAGGMIGDAITQALVPFFNITGTNLLLLCFMLTGITLATGLSWLNVVDGTGFYAIIAYKKSRKLPEYIGQQQLHLPNFGANKKLPAQEKPGVRNIEITSMRPEPAQSDDAMERHFGTATEHEEPEHAEPIDSESPYIDTGYKSEPVTVEVIAEQQQQASPAPASKPAVNESSAVNPGIAGVQPIKLKSKEIDPKLEGTVPSFDLLDRPNKTENPISEEELEHIARLVEAKLADFNVDAKVVGVFPGPVITRFELDLAPGVKVAKITGLAKDLARAMSAMSVRVVEVIPGKSVIGLELPNKHRETVFLSEVIGCNKFQASPSNLTMVLGADISGNPVIVDLAKMPHLLVAGTTGSGKSVGVNVMILSLLYKSTPEDVRFIMIDPKMLELSVYEGIPHLLSEVVTDMKEAANALRWCVGEMERRYRLMSALGVRNLKGFNAKVEKAIEEGMPLKDPLWTPEQSMDTEAPDLEKLPSIVVVVDEFADMMMIVGKKVEELIARIAQKARAAGIHLVLATQRPSVDVITGLIKANIPTRIAFQVSSKIDSRTILDQQGAEALLGMGDMLYLPPGTGVPTRVHGAFVDDHEVHAVVADWKRRGEPQYIDEILNGDATADIVLPGEQPSTDEDQEYDEFYDEAVAFVTETRRASVSGVQRKFRIGYNRAARLVEQMEQNGVVTPPGHNGNRDVLAPPPPKD